MRTQQVVRAGRCKAELAENFVQKCRISPQASYTKSDPRSHLTVRVGQAARSNDQVFDSRGGTGDILGQ